MLMSRGGAPAWEPPSTDGPPPGTVVDGLPALDDPVAASMRPTGARLKLYTVGPTGRDFTTIVEAVTAGSNLRSAVGATRDTRVDILIDPGTYPETAAAGVINIPAHMALYAADGGRRSVTVLAGIECPGWAHQEGIVYDARTSTTAKYGLHHVGNGVSVFSRGNFYNSAATIGSGWAAGMDGVGYGHTVMYDMHLTGPDVNTRTNMHSAISGGADPETMIYVNCVTNGGLEFNPMDSTPAHELWAINCQAAWVGLGGGTGAKFYGSGNTMSDTTKWAAFRKTLDATRTDWPVPVGGLTSYWRTALGLGPA